MKVLTNNQYYSEIANVIREQNGTSNTYTPPQMVRALKDLFYEEVEGVPPISFNGIGENLLDYRIDGASGGVGDRTSNLFTNVWFQGVINTSTGIMETSSTWVCSDFIPITPLITYSCSRTVSREYNNLRCYDANKQYVGTGATNANTGNPLNNGDSFGTFMITNESVAYIRFNDKSNDLTTKYMLVEGEYTASTMPDYEPYGYKVPVVMNGKNLFDELQVVDKTVSSESSNYQIFKQNEKLIINGLTTISQADVEIASINSINNQALQFINSNEAQYIFSAEVPGRIMIRYKLLGSDVVRYTFDEYNSSNRVTDRIVFRLQQNYQYDNETMNIMFKLKQIQSDNYEPYHEPITTNIYLDNPIRTINDEIEYIDYSEQKQHRVRKNLLQNTATSQTVNGVTFTVNNDGSVTCNGTSSATTTFAISIKLNSNINYVLSGSPKNGGTETYRLDLRNISYSVYNNTVDNGNGINFTVEENGTYLVCIRIAANYTCNNLTFYPMIRLASIQDDTYEPYIENTEVDVTLPAIPTLDGTNTLSINTTVQPSNVYVKSRHESSYEAAMRERYEEAQAQLDALESGGE